MRVIRYCILLLVFLPALMASGIQRNSADTLMVLADTVPVQLRSLNVAPLSLPVSGDNRSGDLFKGGQDDGFASSCLPPQIIEHGKQLFECIEDSIVMQIKAQGSELQYKWQKWDANDFQDIVGETDRIYGENTDCLVLKNINKTKDDGLYRCLVYNGCGETPSDTFRMAITSAPVLVSSLQESMTWECVGAAGRNLAVVVTSLNPEQLNYIWWKEDTVTHERRLFDPDKYNTSTLTLKPTSRADEGIYGVEVSNQCGSVVDSVFMPVYMTVTVEEVNIQDRKIVACEGENVDIRVKVAGGGIYDYALKKVKVISEMPLKYDVLGVLATGKSQVTLENVTENMQGTYVWEVSNNCGRDTSEIFKLVVHHRPDFGPGKEFPDTLACENSKLVLSCEAVGEEVEYYWYHNGVNTGVTGNVYTIDTLKPDQEGIYTCYAHNVCIQQTPSRPIRVTVDPLPKILRDPLLLKPVCVGDSLVEINIRFGNARIDSLRWRLNDHFLYDDGVKYEGCTDNKISIFKIQPEEIGMYYVQAYNHCGSVFSQPAELIINEPASLIKGLNGYDMLLCAGEDQQLVVNAKGALPIRYRWLCNEEVIAESDSNVVHVTSGQINEDAEYCIQVENICGGEVHCTRLRVARIQTFPLEGGGEYCDGHEPIGEFNMIGSDTNVVYTLYRDPNERLSEFQGTGDTVNFRQMAAGNYYVVGKDTNGCVQRMENQVEVKLKASPAPGRLIMTDQSCQNNPGANVMMTNWEDGIQYKLYRRYKSEEWEWYRSMMFIGGVVKMGSPAPGELKFWEGLDEGAYKVVAQDLYNGCTRDMVLQDSVVVHPAPRRYTLLAKNNDFVNCSLENELAQLEADAYESGFSYTLKKDGEPYGQILKYSPVRWGLLDQGTYTLEAKNEWGCVSESKPVTIINAESPKQVKIGGNGSICDGDTDKYKELIIEESELGVTYKIYQDFPERYVDEVKGTGTDVSVLLPSSNATYVVDAYDKTGVCKVRLEDRFLVAASDFQAVTNPSEMFLDRGSRTHLHLDVKGTYAQPMVIEWKPENMLEWGIIESPTTQVHRQYYVPFCPCKCSADYSNYHQYSHGPHCLNDPKSCPYLYHTWDPKKHGCVYQGTERILWRGSMVPYYDLYYCQGEFEDDYEIENPDVDIPNPFKDPTTVPLYDDAIYTVTATDGLGCSKTDQVKVKVKGKRLDAEIIFSEVHKHYYVPFCPCGCSDRGGSRHSTHGPGCNESNCWLFYHSHKHEGCTFQKTVPILYEGAWRNYYDLYYCCTSIEATDTIVYRNDELFFCSEASGGDYNFKYTWSFVSEDGTSTIFTDGTEHVKFKARESGYLFLDVTSMGQHRKDSIWIEVLRRPLVTEIRDAQDSTRLDSVHLCYGERIKLWGWAEGGDGDKEYRWYDDEHDLSSYNEVLVKPLKSGYVWFLTTSDGVEVLDSVYIELFPSPKKLDVDDPGVRCVQLDQEEIIRLPKTQKGMNYVLEYRAPGEPNREYGQRYNNATGDSWVFTIDNPVQDAGMYKVRVDTIIGDKVCTTYLDSIEFIAPPSDAQWVDSTYCFGDFGLEVELKSVADSIEYSIVSSKGVVFETIRKPERKFRKLFPHAPYIFRTTRVGELGSCSVDRNVNIRRAPDPDISLEVVANAHGPVCEGSEITVSVMATEKEVKYELVDPNERVVDSFIGDGKDKSFSAFPRPAGVYMIRATRGKCSVNLDNMVRVNKLPRNLELDSIHYCYSSPQKPTAVKVPIELKGLQTDIRYYLKQKAVTLDSLDGPGIKAFEKLQTAGDYQIVAKDLVTKCVSPVNTFSIIADEGPYPFVLSGDCGARQEIRLAESQEGVTYYLYRDNVMVASLAGNHQPLSFGEQRISGTYTVWGEDNSTLCRTKMAGEVKIYELDTCELEVVGSICVRGGDGSVELRYPCSKPGWSYFVEKVSGSTRERGEIIEGTGEELWWRKINNKALKEGIYELWAGNACDTIKVTSVEVKRRPGPSGKLLPIPSACRDQLVEVMVSGGDSEIQYTLLTDVNGYRKPLNEKMGSEDDFSMGKYMNYTRYRLAGAYPDGSCYKEISLITVTQSATPEPLDIIGADVCKTLNGGVQEGEIKLCLPAGREANVNYYLVKGNDTNVLDALETTNPEMCFQTQADTGCYYVMGEHVRTHCRDTMEGLYCLGGLPASYQLFVDDGFMSNTLKEMCIGDSVGLILLNSASDARYQLYRNGVAVGKPKVGQNNMLAFPDIWEAGTYTVVASNGCGSNEMANAVVVRLGEIPDMLIADKYYYCPDMAGADLTIEGTERGSTFDLYRKGGEWGDTWLEQKTSAASGSSVTFDTKGQADTYYRVDVKTRFGCTVTQEFVVRKDTLPDVAYELKSTTDSVICENSCTELYLTGSQKNVEYYLYNTLSGEMAFEIGEGGPVNFGKMCDEGEYYAVAFRHYPPRCNARIPGSVKLLAIDSIWNLEVKVNRNAYCNGNMAKSTVLIPNAQKGITYQLFLNGRPTERKITPNTNGTTVTFEKVDGGSCEHPNIYTIMASNAACSKFMRNSVAIVAEDTLSEGTMKFTPERATECCEGETVTFKTDARECNLKYTWYLGSALLPEAMSSYLKLEKVKASQKGVYSCKAENTCNKVEIGRAELRITPKPVIREHIKSISLCEGQPAYVFSMIDNVHTGDYRWYRTDDGLDTVYSKAPYLEFEKVSKDLEGEYVCEGNSSCTTVRDTFMLYVDVNADSLKVEMLVDTLCVGSPFSARIDNQLVPFDKVNWNFNGVETGVKGFVYTADQIQTKDEGVYSVSISNSCGTKDFPVKHLIVDDSIKVLDLTPNQISCAGVPMDLYIKATPTLRVDYTWYEGETLLGKGNKLSTIVGKDETSRTYRVYCRNACGSITKDVNVSISSFVEFTKNPPLQLQMCADPAGNETLCVELTPGIKIYSYQWFYQHKNSQRIDSLGKEACETVSAQTNKTGFYWCKVDTECKPLSSTATWFKVDTVPVISGLPAKDTLCVGGTKEYTIHASGGAGLVYTWKITDKEGNTRELMIDEAKDFYSSSTCNLGPVKDSWDGAVVSCEVRNSCGNAMLQMTLRVDKARELIVSPYPDTTICANGYAQMRVELKNGAYPWHYRYRDSLGREESRIVSNSLVDEFELDRPGKYNILFVRDGSSCNYADGDIAFELKSNPAPVARIAPVGPDTLCPGEKAQVRVEISYPSIKGRPIPSGPWEVKFIRKDGTPAEELGVTDPYYIYKLNPGDTVAVDTLRPFGIQKSMAYYIGSVRDISSSGGLQCYGQPMDSAVFYLHSRDTLRFDFRSERDTIGYCNTVLLDTLLRPNIVDGEFYVDGILSQLGIFNSPPLEPGKHIIKYKTNGRCPLSNDSVRLWVMPKPVLSVIPRDTALCPGEVTEVVLSTGTNGPAKLKYELRNQKRDGTFIPRPETQEANLPKKVRVENSNSTDSLRIITPMLLTDRFGCDAGKIDTIRAVVEMRRNPVLKIEARHKDYNDGNWADWIDSYVIPKGDSVEFKVQMLYGGSPWVYTLLQSGKPAVDVGPVMKMDTLYTAWEEGQYQFTLTDGFGCFKPGEKVIRTIFYREPGYLKIKMLLEGAYQGDGASKLMHGKLQRLGVLPRRGLTKWPVSGQDSIVDWVTVEVREKPEGPSVASDTFLLRNDGQVITTSGSDILELQNTTKLWGNENQYVVVKHRNHISVMSKNAVKIVDEEHKADIYMLDLTQEANLYCPAGSILDKHAQKMGSGLWALAAGYDLRDVTGLFPDNHLVSISNPNTTKFADNKEIDASYRGYYWRDVNLDGIVQWPDDIPAGDNIFSDYYKNLFKSRDAWILHKNRDKYSAVPLKNN